MWYQRRVHGDHSSFTMPAAPPNVSSIRKAAEGSKRSAEALSLQRDNTLPIVSNRALEPEDESQYEIPPGVDTPWTFGSFIRYFGPGWLVCIAYVDPGNYQADIQSGATTGYTQNWVFLWTQLLSWYVQYMCVKLQHYTNKNLAQAMAMQYPKYVRWMFWVIVGFHRSDGSTRGHRLCHRHQPLQPERAAVRGRAPVLLHHDALPGDPPQGLLLHRAHRVRPRRHHVHRAVRRVGYVRHEHLEVPRRCFCARPQDGPRRRRRHHQHHRCGRHAPQPLPAFGCAREPPVPERDQVQEARRLARSVGSLHPHPLHDGRQYVYRHACRDLRLREECSRGR